MSDICTHTFTYEPEFPAMVIATFKRIIYIRLFRAVRNTRISPIGMYLAYKGTGLGDVKMFENMSISDFVAV
ncbi:hypothetical protein KCU71_g9406, partial [Aureobasidium melanogenum]|jgi:hypothetical protein